MTEESMPFIIGLFLIDVILIWIYPILEFLSSDMLAILYAFFGFINVIILASIMGD